MFEKKMGIRLCKGFLLISAATLLSAIFAGNIFLYNINFEYIGHIMAMDDTFKQPSLMIRAVTNPLYHHVAYVLIIVLEGLASLLLWVGVYQTFKNISQPRERFNQAKYWGMVGLLFSLLIYSFVFYGIGGEWFASWQSTKWNSKSATMPFIVIFGLFYLIFSQPERDDYKN